MASLNFGDDHFLLRNGLYIPSVGVGTYRIRDSETMHRTVDTALKVGYRLFDTASVYGNERMLGEALRQLLPKHGLDRDDVFITTKLSPADHGTGFVEKALDQSLENLGLKYVDMYLVHFPGAAKIRAEDVRNKTLRHETWKEIAQIYSKGKAHGIGVSNFTVAHLTELDDVSLYRPLVNQVEWHPYYFQPDLLDYCIENGIRLQAYSSFGGTSIGKTELLNEPVIKKIAAEHEITVHQVLLLWALQKQVAVIPKAVTPAHIEKNYELSDRLTEDEMEEIDGLNKNLKYFWNPNTVA